MHTKKITSFKYMSTLQSGMNEDKLIVSLLEGENHNCLPFLSAITLYYLFKMFLQQAAQNLSHLSAP